MLRVTMVASRVGKLVTGFRHHLDDWWGELAARIGEMTNLSAKPRLEVSLGTGDLVEALLGRFVRQPGVGPRVRADDEPRSLQISNHLPGHRPRNRSPFETHLGVQKIHHEAKLRLRYRRQQHRGEDVRVGARRAESVDDGGW